VHGVGGGFLRNLVEGVRRMKIEMAHGGGGVQTNELIRDVFAKHLSNEYLDPMGDSAVLTLPGTRIAMTTDAFVVKPLFFPGGDIGRLSVCGTVNDLLMRARRRCTSRRRLPLRRAWKSSIWTGSPGRCAKPPTRRA
jgi:hypothetical protein